MTETNYFVDPVKAGITLNVKLKLKGRLKTVLYSNQRSIL